VAEAKNGVYGWTLANRHVHLLNTPYNLLLFNPKIKNMIILKEGRARAMKYGLIHVQDHREIMPIVSLNYH